MARASTETGASDEDESHGGTRLESVEEIRRAVEAVRGGAAPRKTVTENDAAAFRPSLRPPLLLLCALDDGGDDGEWRRLRAERTVIGREEGDVRIEHELLMSSRHAELVRRQEGGRWRWWLVDLGSTNGTFVRVANCVLRHGQEFLIGRHRLRFDDPLKSSAPPTPDVRKGTVGWQGVTASQLPTLVELAESGDGRRHPLVGDETWIGRSPAACSLAFPDDPGVSGRHARVFRDADGRLLIENAGSQNGLWIRVQRQPIDGSCQFQLGEQRFLTRLA